MPDEKLGKYEIRGTLGKGAMGTVLDGWDPILLRRVAIKTVSLTVGSDSDAQDNLARFMREAQAAGRLTHSNIVGAYDYGETDTVAYIVMEFVDGRTLKDVLDKKEVPELANLVRIMDDLLTGLQYSHDHGVVHRDIKPANVMLTKEGQAKIADFGIARIENSNLTQAGTVLGTLAYMSPEQLSGQVVDLRTDVYSSGVLLYELLTGERPFDGSMASIIHKVLNVSPPKPSALAVTLPSGFDDVVARAMAKRPDERFASAAAFAEAIRAARAAPAQAPPPAADPPGEPDPPADDGKAEMSTPAPSAPMPVTDPPPARPDPVVPEERREEQKGGGGKIAAIGIAVAVVLAALSGGAYYGFGGGTNTITSGSSVVNNNGGGGTPPRSQAEIRGDVESAIKATTCAILADYVSDQNIAVEGAASDESLAKLRTSIGKVAPTLPVQWNVRTINTRFCRALDIIRPIAVIGRAGAFSVRTDKLALVENDFIQPRVALPNWPAHLQVVYIANDNSILYITPDKFYPDTVYTARSTQIFGEPHRDFPGWQVGSPFGTDMIIAIASSAQLLPPRAAALTNDTAEDNAGPYLDDLKAAIERADKLPGGSITASVFFVDTVPARKP